MNAAVIGSRERGPRFAGFTEPTVASGRTLVEVTAAGSPAGPAAVAAMEELSAEISAS